MNQSDDDFVVHKLLKKTDFSKTKKCVKSSENSLNFAKVETKQPVDSNVTLEKTYLKRDNILDDISNGKTQRRSPPHSTPIPPHEKKRKFNDSLPDIIPSTPEEDMVTKNCLSIEKKNLLKAKNLKGFDELVVPDMVLESHPIKFQKVLNEKKKVVNLVDLTKETFEEIHSSIFSEPVKKLISVSDSGKLLEENNEQLGDERYINYLIIFSKKNYK